MRNQDGWWCENFLKKEAIYSQNEDGKDWWFEGLKFKHGDLMTKGT